MIYLIVNPWKIWSKYFEKISKSLLIGHEIGGYTTVPDVLGILSRPDLALQRDERGL